MRWLIYMISVVVMLAVSFSCEDVIEVDVPSEEPRLIIDALIRVDTLQAITNVCVKVTESTSFFETPKPAALEQITLAGAVLLEQSEGSGIYCREVSTQQLMQDELFLAIDYKDQIFAAFTNFATGVPIDSLQQGPGGQSDDETELVVSITDDPDKDNFYLFDFDRAEFLTTEDQFYQGQSFSFSFFYEDELPSGTELDVSLLGITPRFHSYMEKIIEQSESEFDLFDTPAITVRGNILNATDIVTISDLSEANLETNFPLGYFAVVQEYKKTIIIE
ncbi:MAG: DUF4249 family protein [Bacteroidota bacterium]